MARTTSTGVYRFFLFVAAPLFVRGSAGAARGREALGSDHRAQAHRRLRAERDDRSDRRKPPDRPKYGTVGLPLPLTDVRIVDLEDPGIEMLARSARRDRGPRSAGDEGLLETAGRDHGGVPRRYFLTGDIGVVDEEGYFSIVERKKDMVKISAYSVFPAEVEAILYRHPAVAEAGVVGVPAPYRGEDPVAFVVPKFKGKVREEEIAEWCRAEMAVYKAPRRVRFIDALPKTASANILKLVLRDQARAQGSRA